MCLVVLTALINYNMMTNSDLTFLTNNVSGIQSSRKKYKDNWILWEKFNYNAVLFLQETHSNIKNENS